MASDSEEITQFIYSGKYHGVQLGVRGRIVLALMPPDDAGNWLLRLEYSTS